MSAAGLKRLKPALLWPGKRSGQRRSVGLQGSRGRSPSRDIRAGYGYDPVDALWRSTMLQLDESQFLGVFMASAAVVDVWSD